MKSKTLKSRLKRLRGEHNLLMREWNAIQSQMHHSGNGDRSSSILTKCSILAILGFGAGLLLRNPAAAPILSILFALIPIWNLRLYHIQYNKHIASQLESSLSLVTSSYIRSGNLECAVSENLPYFDPLLCSVFEEFLTEYKVNAHMETCISDMSRKIDNRIFIEWCTGLVKVYQNSSLKEELILTISKLSSIRIVQENLDTETGEIITQYVIMLILLVGTLPLISLVNYEWFLFFFTHPLGKISVAFAVFALLYGINSIIRCSKPVSFDL